MRFKLCISKGENILREGIYHLQRKMYRKRMRNYKGDNLNDLQEYLLNNNYLNAEEVKYIQRNSDFYCVPLYQVYKRYTITKIVQIDGCTACEYAEPGQRAHMECPYGCLHNRANCDLC